MKFITPLALHRVPMYFFIYIQCSNYHCISSLASVLDDICIHLQIDLRRAYNCEIMLTKVKIPLPDLMVS